MFEKLIQLDRELFVFLNSLGSERFDFIWVLSTHQKNWLPFFIILLVLIYVKKGLKNTLILLLFISLLILVGDQFTNLVKNNVQRIRPSNDIGLKDYIRILHNTPTYSYFSGHATNSMSTMVFIFLVMRSYYKYFFLIFLWPLIFAYSRIYVGVHFPLDILSGYLVGALLGFIFYRAYLFTINKYVQKLA